MQLNLSTLKTIGLLFVLLLTYVPTPQANGEKTDTMPPPNWKDDWALAEGFTIQEDIAGLQFPTDIEFIPNPSKNPKDPLYFVLELKGTLKVVTNDRSVYVFADNFIPVPLKERFETLGAAGMCLDPSSGYIFVTFGYLDRTQIFRNGIVRFHSTPEKYGIEELGRTVLLDLFENERSDTSHQIGPCLIQNSNLFVPVGYGKDRRESQNLSSTSGAILRMDTNLQPWPDNPFYSDDGTNTANDYIWTYGHRNVFGLESVGEKIFATDNGGSIDKFVEIIRGENYLWRGNDWSFASRSNYIFSPAAGLVQLDFLQSQKSPFPARYDNHFFIAMAGTPGAAGPTFRGQRSIAILDYDFEKSRVAMPPTQFLTFRGSGYQLPVSLQFGEEGLYFIALLPQSDGKTRVMKITHNPSIGHPHTVEQNRQPEALINRYGCRECHKILGNGGNFGPILDSTLLSSIAARLNHDDYQKQVDTVDSLDSSPFREWKSARQDVLNAESSDRLLIWLKHYLQEPVFDNPQSQMPNLGMDHKDALAIAVYLLDINDPKKIETQADIAYIDRLRFLIANLLPELRYRHILVAFFLGVMASLTFVYASTTLRSRRTTDK